jgi:wobble nucleotide-excising tRNase
MTIRRITRIADYRIYRNWTNPVPARDFARLNIIYGTNGSGKSTVAQLFQDCVDGVAGADVGLSLSLTNGGTATSSSTDFWRRVHIFNHDYVRRNLLFERDGGPEAESLVVLGESNVRAEEEIAEAASQLEILSRNAELRTSAVARLKRELDALLKRTAETVVSELGPASPRYRATNVYRTTHVRILLGGDRSVFDDASGDQVADMEKVRTNQMDSIARVERAVVATDDDLPEIVALLDTEITANAIAALANDSEVASWVQSGLHLHVDSDVCLFCGNALSVSRRRALENHFDDSVRRVQASIDVVVRKLAESKSRVGVHLQSFPRVSDVYGNLADALSNALNEYQRGRAAYEFAVDAIIEKLEEKRSNPFATVSLPSGTTLSPPETRPVDAIVEEHNSRAESLVAERANAARRMELLHVFEIAEVFDSLTAELESEETAASDATTQIDQLRATVQSLTHRSADPTPLAAELTTALSRLLGRDELTFETTGDGARYRLLRSGEPAEGLSEGERTAVALLHFLARMKSAAVEAAEPIVVIDDPVSSLDQNILFGVSAHIWSELAPLASGISQVILLTHSFELFRQWVYQLQHVPAAFIGPHTIHEIKIRNRPGAAGPIRVPILEPWPDDPKLSARMRSQYHFLFAKVADAIAKAEDGSDLYTRMDALALAPNAARKMLEAFLSFKFPGQIGDFHGSLRAALGQVPGSAPYRNRVERYLHAYSHDEEGDLSDPLLPGEAASVLASVFELINGLDPAHFEAMCESLDVDRTSLTSAMAQA